MRREVPDQYAEYDGKQDPDGEKSVQPAQRLERRLLLSWRDIPGSILSLEVRVCCILPASLLVIGLRFIQMSCL
jgi:hypothetical protein